MKYEENIADWCFKCQCSGQTVDHHLINCEGAYQLWSSSFRYFGVSWFYHRGCLIFWLGELVGEVLSNIKHLEFGTAAYDVDQLEGA